MLKIEKNIPVPPRTRTAGGGKWQKCVDNMNVGDSVLIEKAGSLYSALNKLGFSAVMRKEGDKFRVWKGAKK